MDATVTRVNGTLSITPVNPRVTPCNLIEFAKELIEQEGWNDTYGGVNPAGYQMSSPTVGWTLHDSIGEAGNRIFQEEGSSTAGKGEVVWPGDPTTMRKQAVEIINKYLPEGETDYTFNDKATSKQEIIQFLDMVIQRECA